MRVWSESSGGVGVKDGGARGRVVGAGVEGKVYEGLGGGEG